MPERLDPNSHPADAKYASFQLLLEAGTDDLHNQIAQQKNENAYLQHGFEVKYYKNPATEKYLAVVTQKGSARPPRVIAPGEGTTGELKNIIDSAENYMKS